MPSRYGYSSRTTYRRVAPRYRTMAKKLVYARKRQSANVKQSRSLYTRYTQPRTIDQSTNFDIRRLYNASSIVKLQSSTTFSDKLIGFRITYLPDYVELSALYDAYRVNKLVFHFIPAFNYNAQAGLGATAAASDPGKLITAVDFDGGVTGLSEDAIRSYETAQITGPNQRHTVTIQPRAELLLNDATPTPVSAALVPTNTWFDFSNVNINFWGVRCGVIPNSLLDPQYGQLWTVEVEAFLTCKMTR